MKYEFNNYKNNETIRTATKTELLRYMELLENAEGVVAGGDIATDLEGITVYVDGDLPSWWIVDSDGCPVWEIANGDEMDKLEALDLAQNIDTQAGWELENIELRDANGDRL